MASSESTANHPASVYRYFDRSGILIYVGMTTRRTARNVEHNRDKAWWPYVHSQKVEHFDTKDLALDRERELIERFQPPFNVQHNRGHIAARSAYLDWVTSAATVTVETLARDHGKLMDLVCMSDRPGQVVYLPHPAFAEISSHVRRTPKRFKIPETDLRARIIYPKQQLTIVSPVRMDGVRLRLKLLRDYPPSFEALHLDRRPLGVAA